MGIAERLGIDPKKLPNPHIRRRNPNLIVAGSGRCLWDDLDKVGIYPDPRNPITNWDVMCVNDAIMHFPPPIKHGFSNDAKTLTFWWAARRPDYRVIDKRDHGDILLHTCMTHKNKSFIFWPWPGHGTSSLNAVYTGLQMGYESILLVGIPLDNSGHYFEPPWVETNFECQVPQRADGPRNWDDAARKIFDGKVKCVSGRLTEILPRF